MWKRPSVPRGKALLDGGLPCAEITFRTAAAADFNTITNLTRKAVRNPQRRVAKNGRLKNPASSQHALFRQNSIQEDAETLRAEIEGQLEQVADAAAWAQGTDRGLQDALDGVLSAWGKPVS